MEVEALSAVLEREHRQVDEGIDAFTSALAEGTADTSPLKRATEALRRHIYLEEGYLFPPLRRAGLMAPIMVMLREHGELWQTMDRLQTELARGVATSPVRELCAELRSQLDRHNSKEEPIIYPQADSMLTSEATDQLQQLLATGQLPEGWVCQQAKV